MTGEPGNCAARAPEDLTARLLRAAGAGVTGVDIDVALADTGELDPEAAVARIELDGPAGARNVTARITCAPEADCQLRQSPAVLARGSKANRSSSPCTEPYGRVAVFLDIVGNRYDLLGPP